jgi:hypothetical protein
VILYEFSNSLDLAERKLRWRSLQISPYFTERTLEITTMPLQGRVSSPVAMHGRARQTNERDVRLSLRWVDWWRWCDWKWLRRAAAAARSTWIPAKCGGEIDHVWVWKLSWVLGTSYKRFVGHGRERMEVFTSGGNGGRWQKEKLAQGRRGRGFYSRRGVERRFAWLSSSTRGHGMGEGQWNRGKAPPANGGLGVRAPACAGAARVTGLWPGARHAP